MLNAKELDELSKTEGTITNKVKRSMIMDKKYKTYFSFIPSFNNF